jgi:hypothetical protein
MVRGMLHMLRRSPVRAGLGSLEYCAHSFDDFCTARVQRRGFRHYLDGLLLSTELRRLSSST